MKDDEAKLIAHINATAGLLSLLYDLDLMPEQLKEGTHQWGQMLTIAAWSAVGAMKFEPPPQAMNNPIPAPPHEHLITKLHRLRREVDSAIESFKTGGYRPCTPAETEEHAQRYGEGAWTLGEFVITERNSPPESNPCHPAAKMAAPDPENGQSHLT